MRAYIAAVVLAASGCGRVGFTAVAGHVDDADTADGTHQPITYRQSAGADPGIATSVTLTIDNIVAGDLLLVGISMDIPPQPIAITDTFASSFTEVCAGEIAPLVAYLYYTAATQSGTDSITATIATPPNSYFQLQLWEYAGIRATDPFDDCAQAHGTTMAVDGATTRALSVSTTNELVFGYGEFFSSGGAGTGFTLRTIFEGDSGEDRIETVPGAYPVTMTLDSGGSLWTVVGATFRGT